MKNLILLVFIFFVIPLTISAQDRELFVKKAENSLYLEHKVVAKETYYSLGRLYHLAPRSIATYNKLNMEKGLNIDQKVRIPLNDSNFTQKDNAGIPVYYKVKDNDGLLKISSAHRNVSVEKLRKWNNLSGDNIREGAKLIVGYLVGKEDATVVTEPVTEPKTEEKPANTSATEEKKPDTSEENKTVIKEETKPEPVAVKEESKPATVDPGYFKKSFEQQVKAIPVSKNETVTAGIFKTSSGWQDLKYYLLIDKVPPGTIIKLINPSNNLFVYAKVLGEMSGIRQNEGLNIRISNAAGAALQVTETDKFIVKITY